MKRDEEASPQQQAYNFIRAKILSGGYQAGAWLKTDTIAQQLSISRMPVRDALRQLDSEGLVTIRLNRGATVTNLTLQSIFEIFEMRAVLEGLAASIAAEMATESDILELELRIKQMELAKSDRLRWLERHDAVHELLCSISGRRELVDQINNLRMRVRPYLLMYSSSHGDPELPGFEHWRFLEPLREGNSAEAERIVRGHVLANARTIIAELGDATGESLPEQLAADK